MPFFSVIRSYCVYLLFFTFARSSIEYEYIVIFIFEFHAITDGFLFFDELQAPGDAAALLPALQYALTRR